MSLSITDFENRWVYESSCVLYLPLSHMDGGRGLKGSGLITWSATADQRDNWTSGYCLEADETSNVKVSVHSLKLTADDGGSVGAGVAYQQYASATVGVDYTMTAWVRGNPGNDSGQNIAIAVQDVGGSWTKTQANLTDITSATWERLSVTHTAGLTTIQFLLYVTDAISGDTDDIAYFDGVTLYEEGGLIDRSGYGTPININGAYRDGVNGWKFDGVDDYLWIPVADCDQLDFTTEAFSGIIRCVIGTEPSALQYLLSRGAWNTKGWACGVAASMDWRLYTWGGTDANSEATTQFSAGDIVTLGFTKDAANAYMFVNGDNKTDIAGTHGSPATNTTNNLVVGASSSGGSSWIDSNIKCILIFNRPLGAVEHADIAREMEEVFP